MKRGERFLRDEPEKYLSIKEGWLLRGITLTLTDGQWRMIVKITDAQGNHLVCFIVTSSIYDCWWYLYKHLTTTNTPLRWSTDKYYVK